MKTPLSFIYTLFFILGWFFFPFNDFEGIKALGEYKNEACFYFFIIGFLFVIIESALSNTISFPYKNKIFTILFIFLIWCFITILFNLNTVIDSYFKQTTGINRFIRQYISLLLATLIFPILYWNVIRKWSAQEILLKIRKVLLISLIFVFVYGFLETLIVVFNLNMIKPILQVFDFFPFLNVNYQPGGRISSVAYESPSLGNYLITISAWMFSFIFTHNSVAKYFPFLMVLFLTFFSGSRSAFISVGVQVILLIFIMYKMREHRENVLSIFKYSLFIILTALVINSPKIIKEADKKIESLNFKKNLTKNISNQSRFGMQYASLQVFKENPIVGVGFGQETYHKRLHYPAWAKKNNYEFKFMYENKKLKSFPSSYNIYTRLLAETGIIGFIIFVYIIYICINESYLIWKNKNNETKILGLILVISFSGLSINWMQTDFFRQHGFWISLIILIKILYHNEKTLKI